LRLALFALFALLAVASPARGDDAEREERETADLVRRMAAEEAEERAAHPPPLPPPPPSLLDRWLATREIGLSFGVALDLAVLSFHAAGTPPAAETSPCTAIDDDRQRCEVITAGGGSGRVNAVWQPRFERRGLWHFEPGWSSGLHYHFSHGIRFDDARRATREDGRDVGVGLRAGAQLVTGLTPHDAPDLLLTLLLGPSLVYGETETAVGPISYLTVGALTSAALDVVWLARAGGRFATYASVETHESLAVRAFGGRDVTRFRPALARIEAGLRATFAL